MEKEGRRQWGPNVLRPKVMGHDPSLWSCCMALWMRQGLQERVGGDRPALYVCYCCSITESCSDSATPVIEHARLPLPCTTSQSLLIFMFTELLMLFQPTPLLVPILKIRNLYMGQSWKDTWAPVSLGSCRQSVSNKSLGLGAPRPSAITSGPLLTSALWWARLLPSPAPG